MCEENKLELEKNDAYRNKFVVGSASFKDHIGIVERCVETKFSRMIHHSTKVLVIFYVEYYCMCKMTFGCHHRNERQKLVDWLVLKNGGADLIDRSAISSTRQEVPGL